jgi:hypothetical protein
MIARFPKVFAIGHKVLQNLFKGTVEVTEKVDGSQFGFAKVDDRLFCRSRGKELDFDYPEKMFKPGMDYIKSIKDLLPDRVAFYGEYLQKPKHNTLAYDNIPLNHIALFAAVTLDTQNWASYSSLVAYARAINVDVVPDIYHGEIENPEEILNMLDRESYLGGQNIEGVVVKNYKHDNMIGDMYIPLLCGKYVTEKFKEKHQTNYTYKSGKSKVEELALSLKSEARWEKAILHLKEAGELLQEPKDIGGLIKEVHQDIIDEDLDAIKEDLWRIYRKDIMKASVLGLPEWYKEKLLKGEI